MVRRFVIAVALIAGFATAGFAKERSFGEIFTDCGLGGMIGSAVGDQAGNVLAVITNITWDLGTTATSSNVSSPDTCANNKEKTAMFIYENLDYIAADLAKGGGMHMASLLQVSGCAPEIREIAVIDLRGSFAEMLSASDYPASTRYQRAERFFAGYIGTLNAAHAGKCNLT